MDMDPGVGTGKRPRLQPTDDPYDCNVLGFDGFGLHESVWILELRLSACSRTNSPKHRRFLALWHLCAAGGTAGSKPEGNLQIQNVEDDSLLLTFPRCKNHA